MQTDKDCSASLHTHIKCGAHEEQVKKLAYNPPLLTIIELGEVATGGVSGLNENSGGTVQGFFS